MRATRTASGRPAVTDGSITVPVASMSVAHQLELQDRPPTDLAELIEQLKRLEAAAMADLENVQTRDDLRAWKRRWIG